MGLPCWRCRFNLHLAESTSEIMPVSSPYSSLINCSTVRSPFSMAACFSDHNAVISGLTAIPGRASISAYPVSVGISFLFQRDIVSFLQRFQNSCAGSWRTNATMFIFFCLYPYPSTIFNRWISDKIRDTNKRSKQGSFGE